MEESISNHSDDSDCELMLYIQFKEEDSIGSESALGELFSRHHQYFMSVGLRFFNNSNVSATKEIVEELVIDSWRKVYDSAESYQVIDSNDKEESRKVFRAWGGKILRNTILDWYKLKKNKEELSYQYVDINEYLESQFDLTSDTDQESISESGVDSVFSLLTEKEADVIRLLLLHLGTDLLNSNLPVGVIDAIAKDLNTQPENIRQLKSRAVRKIRKTLKMNSGTDHDF